MHLLCPHCQSPIELVDPADDEILCTSCGSSFRLERDQTTSWNPSPAQRRLGKFELVDRVGMGSFGTVFKAHDTELDRIVAIKVPRAGNLGSAGDTDRFLREARSVARLRHPSIVPVYEVGTHEGVPFLVTEFVEGITLADLLTEGRPCFESSAELIAAVAEAMQYAHDQGVVHRDVKPSNIMLERGPEMRDQSREPHGSQSRDTAGSRPSTLSSRPKILDFGLAKREAGEITMTIEGQVLGTPAYMSPEQARGEAHRVDGRSDIYSLGVILFQLLTGRLPFSGNQRLLLHHVQHDEPKPPRKLDANIPRSLETICLKAMAKEPQRRYGTARELADDLRRYLAGEPIQASPAKLPERLTRFVKRRRREISYISLGAGLMGLVPVLILAGVLSGKLGFSNRPAAIVPVDQDDAVAVEYYANVIKRWGVPEGIGRVSPKEVQRRNRTYKFFRRRGQVESLEVINGHGVPVVSRGWVVNIEAMDSLRGPTGTTRECRFEYRRSDQQQLTEEVAKDIAGNVAWIFHYTTKDTGHFTDRRGFPLARAGSGAAYVAFEFSPEGFVRQRRFLDRNGKPRRNQDGVYGYRYELNERGLPVHFTCLNAQGKPMLNNEGYAASRTAYNADGEAIEVEYFDREGRPAFLKDGYAKVKSRYDGHGNPTEETFLGIDGQPAQTRIGFSTWSMKWNDSGDLVECGSLDPNGKRVAYVQEMAGAYITYDERGNLLEYASFGTDGKPVLMEGRYSKSVKTYDERNQIVAWAAYDLEGKPAATLEGFARWTKSFDDRGNQVEIAYFGPDGSPFLIGQGYARMTKTYDESDRLLTTAYFGVQGEPIVDAEGCAKLSHQYDDRGNQIETAYYGRDGQLVLNQKGFARAGMSYDERGNLIEVEYLGTDDQPVTSKLGYARRAYSYNDDDQLLSSAYFDAAGEAVATQVHVIKAPKTDAPWEVVDWQPGDILATYGGRGIHCAKQLLEIVRREGGAQQPQKLTLMRDGQTISMEVHYGLPLSVESQLETRAFQ